MTKQEKMIYIKSRLTGLVGAIKVSNKQSFSDINRYSEGTVRKLLNAVYGYSLRDLNQDRINFPGIDLGNEKLGIGVQVSANVDVKKILHTYEVVNRDKFKDKTIIDFFPHIYFFALSDNSRKKISNAVNRKLALASRNDFDESRVITVLNLLEKIDDSNINEVYKIVREDLDDNMPPLPTEQAVMEKIVSYFDRPAMMTPFQAECSYIDFEKALREIIALINTGKSDGQAEKLYCKSDIASEYIREKVGDIVDGVDCLRYCYLDMLRSGEIIVIGGENSRVLVCQDRFGIMDSLRVVLIYLINNVAEDVGIKGIRIPSYAENVNWNKVKQEVACGARKCMEHVYSNYVW